MSIEYADTGSTREESPKFLDAAKRICIEWEKLRILYNGALIALVVYLVDSTQPAMFQTFDFWVTCGLGAVAANLCFFAGPLCETYLYWIGVRTATVRWSLLLVGTLLAGFLAGGVLFAMV